MCANYSNWTQVDFSPKLLKLRRIRYLKLRRRTIIIDNIILAEEDPFDPNLPVNFQNLFQENMAGTYNGHVLNDELFNNLYMAKFFLVGNLHTLTDNLLKIDYSVVDSRRQGHAWINEFIDSGILGRDLFNDNPANDNPMRFRFNGRDDQFVTDLDGNFYGVIIGLTSVLSYRTTAVAKDTGAAIASGGKQSSEKMELAVDAAGQDNTKRFEELRKRLKTYTKFGSHTMNRAVFERNVATWVAN